MLLGIYRGTIHAKQLFANLINFQAIKNDVFSSVETPLEIKETIKAVIRHQSLGADQEGVTITFKERMSKKERVLAD